jgi:hypothetical protein
MKAAVVDASRPSDVIAPRLRVLVLARAASSEGATAGELAKELAPYVSHKLAPAAWRDALKQTVATLTSEGLLTQSARGRLVLTAPGRTAALRELGAKALPKSWIEIRDTRLVALALGLRTESEKVLKALAKPDGLRAAILQRAFGFNAKGPLSTARLRSLLAIAALERAFGNSIKAGVGSRTGLSGKLARLLAAQLSVRPRDFGTDQRLIATLAAEKAGSFQTDADSLRVALLRTWVAAAPAALPSSPRPAPQPVAPVAREPWREAARPAAANRPDLPGFALAVLTEAAGRADGWSGSRKAFISHVWRAIEARHPEWGLSSVEFKAMLAEAHRTGHISLAHADLKDQKSLADIQESAVAYRNAVYHFVRVEE